MLAKTGRLSGPQEVEVVNRPTTTHALPLMARRSSLRSPLLLFSLLPRSLHSQASSRPPSTPPSPTATDGCTEARLTSRTWLHQSVYHYAVSAAVDRPLQRGTIDRLIGRQRHDGVNSLRAAEVKYIDCHFLASGWHQRVETWYADSAGASSSNPLRVRTCLL